MTARSASLRKTKKKRNCSGGISKDIFATDITDLPAVLQRCRRVTLMRRSVVIPAEAGIQNQNKYLDSHFSR
ncbi:MAG: hypothetical protein KKF10_01815, partial [Verrucomicrobia bacterium]|nr:hypothetical protein [Verrucomicrobiota bacterium]